MMFLALSIQGSSGSVVKGIASSTQTEIEGKKAFVLLYVGTGGLVVRGKFPLLPGCYYYENTHYTQDMA